MSSSRSPLLDLPGAVARTDIEGAVHDDAGPGVAWHYGDPMREQRALAETVGFVDRSDRDVLTVTGADRLTWLHSLTSQYLTDLVDGQATEALVLSPHGHVEHDVQLVELDATVWLDVEPGSGEALRSYLDSMRFWSAVEVAEQQYAVLTVAGPDAPVALVAATGVGAPAPGHATSLPDGGFVRGMSWPGPGAVDLVVPRDRLRATADRLIDAGALPAGSWAFDALRVAARQPRLGAETDHRTIPHEVGWIDGAVHLHKGCYRGQETVARVANLGRPPRRLVLLHLDGSTESLPVPGSAITLDGKAVGFVGTAVHHWELGPVALGLVKRNVADDAELRIGGTAASIDA